MLAEWESKLSLAAEATAAAQSAHACDKAAGEEAAAAAAKAAEGGMPVPCKAPCLRIPAFKQFNHQIGRTLPGCADMSALSETYVHCGYASRLSSSRSISRHQLPRSQNSATICARRTQYHASTCNVCYSSRSVTCIGKFLIQPVPGDALLYVK